MSFHPYKVAPKSAAGGGTGIAASLKRTNKSSARLTLSVTADRAAEFGWAHGDGLEVLLGEDEHHGLIRLRKNNSVGTAMVSKRQAARGVAWFAVPLGHIPAFVDRSEPKKHCQFEVVEQGWVEVVLPSWADETGKSAKPARPTTALITPAPQRGKDVVGGLMGDPPKGRSALDQRK